MPWDPPWPAPAPGHRHRHRHDGISRRPPPVPSRLRIPRRVTVEDRTCRPRWSAVSSVPMTRHSPRHRSCVLPAIASAATGSAAAPGDGAAHSAPLLVGTPTRAIAASSELHPAGRRIALKPPYPRHGPLLHSLERTCKRAKQGRQSGVFGGRVWCDRDVQFSARLCPECRSR